MSASSNQPAGQVKLSPPLDFDIMVRFTAGRLFQPVMSQTTEDALRLSARPERYSVDLSLHSYATDGDVSVNWDIGKTFVFPSERLSRLDELPGINVISSQLFCSFDVSSARSRDRDIVRSADFATVASHQIELYHAARRIDGDLQGLPLEEALTSLIRKYQASGPLRHPPVAGAQ